VEKITTNKKIVLKALRKMISNKEAILAYSQGKITKKQLIKKGIKLANPL
jgi:hypothetical protein